MTTYPFVITETRVQLVHIEAENLEAAAEEVVRQYEEVEINLDANDIAQVTFEYEGTDAPEDFEIPDFY